MAQPQPKHQHGSISRGINAILLGAPGSGKGTQVSNLKQTIFASSCKAHPVIAQPNRIKNSEVISLALITKSVK